MKMKMNFSGKYSSVFQCLYVSIFSLQETKIKCRRRRRHSHFLFIDSLCAGNLFFAMRNENILLIETTVQLYLNFLL